MVTKRIVQVMEKESKKMRSNMPEKVQVEQNEVQTDVREMELADQIGQQIKQIRGNCQWRQVINKRKKAGK